MPLVTKEKIIATFNGCVGRFEEAHTFAAAGNIGAAHDELSSSAGMIYNTLEWFLKNYLLNIFTDPIADAANISIVEGNNFYRKLQMFKQIAIPDVSTVSVDFGCITELKQSIRNDPEHSGAVPHYESLLKVISETRKLLVIYLQDISLLLKDVPVVSPIQINVTSEWNKLLNSMDSFDDEHNFILIADLESYSAEMIRPLGLVNWNAIIDLDQNSEISGLYSCINGEISSKRPIHKFTLNDTLPISFSDRACYWIYGNGLNGRSGSMISDFKFWKRNYSIFFHNVFSKLQAAIAIRPTTVLILSERINYITTVVESLFNLFVSSVKFVIAYDGLDRFSELASEYDGIQVQIKVADIMTGLLSIRTYFEPFASLDEITIPHKDHGSKVISLTEYQWLSEDLELFQKTVSLEAFDSKDERIDFYKGGALSIKGLLLGYSLNRDIESNLEQKLDKNLRERLLKKLTLYHYPGIGATTVAKRVAWRLKDKFPVAFISQYRPLETVSRIYQLFQWSNLPPLIVMDSESVNNESRDRIFTETLARNFPVTYWEIQRKENRPSKLGNEEEYWSDILTDGEVLTFSLSYSELVPSKKQALNAIVASTIQKEKHPLFFGLTAFEDKFAGLGDFIKKAIISGSSDQKKIVAIICFCGLYAQKPISAQCFTGLLSMPESATVRLEEHLNVTLLHLIIRDHSLEWKPLHYLIAKEYLVAYFGNDVNLMRSGLADLSIDLINILNNRSFDPSKEEFDLLNRLYIDREDEGYFEEDEGKRFSKLIEEGIIDNNAKLLVFEALTDAFPSVVHYWSHLARFYNLVIKDQNKALDCIDKAIDLDKDSDKDLAGKDATLYHIKGMILSSKSKNLMYQHKYNDNITAKDLQEIRSFVDLCGKQFEISRNLNPNSAYGYITNVDAITGYIDFRFSKSGLNDRSKFLSTLDSYDLNLFREAQLLLEELRSRLNHDDAEYYFTRSINNIRNYYANYNSIIQSWQNLLAGNRNGDKSVIRQNLVYAYVSRSSGWANLPQKDVSKIVNLLDENILHDPNDGKNIFLWFRAARLLPSISIGMAINKIVRWKTNTNSIESKFYLSILYVIEAINNNSVSAQNAIALIKDVSDRTRQLPYRSYVSELFGRGSELTQIIPRKSAIISEEGIREFKLDHSKLITLQGRVTTIFGPESGLIEFASGLQASFIPARANNGDGIVRGRDENCTVKFYLGFCYDGLRALDVIKVR